MKEYLRKMLMDADGHPSNKRHLAWVCVLVAAAGSFCGWSEPAIGVWLGAAFGSTWASLKEHGGGDA
jgi:hypothetical protein